MSKKVLIVGAGLGGLATGFAPGKKRLTKWKSLRKTVRPVEG